MNSNKACCWILTILVGGFVLTMLLIGFGISRALSGGVAAKFESSAAVKPDSWLVMNLSEGVADYNAEPDLGLLGGGHGSSLNDILRAVEMAKEDKDIKGIILRPQGVTGMASLREIRQALLDFKNTDKPIYAHLDIASDRDYYLSSVADSIFLMPGRLSGINFGGMAFSNTYVKNTFEKLGIKFNVFHAGRYKGAYEDLAKDSMSADLRASIVTLYEDIYQTYVRETADSRKGLTFAALDNEIRNGDQFFVSAASCIDRGYVDALQDWPVLRKRLQGDAEEFQGISPRKYVAAKRRPELPATDNEIAVMFAEGEINFGSEGSLGDDGITAKALGKQFEELAEDDNVKAVVLRVNSPGGSALASKQILEAARRLQAEKPLVVSMGGVAASGGYYISLAADKIVAQPNTVTGSIGVVTVIPSAEALYQKIGAREETISIGRWANFFRIDKNMNPEQEQVILSLMDTVYSEFRDDVTAGRGLNSLALDTVAEGRVWTGYQALARGLVDTLGGIEDAIKIAAQRASLGDSEYRVAYYPEQEDVFTFFVRQFSARVKVFDQAGEALTALRDPEAIKAYLQNYFDRLEFVKAMLPAALEQ